MSLDAVTKFFWSAIDRVVFIGVGVIGTVATTYVTGIMKLNPPELKATPAYSYVDASNKAPAKVGSLALDYRPDAPRSYGVLRVDIANEGRGPAQKVRFQVKIPAGPAVVYDAEPDFKVYGVSAPTLAGNEFYAELASFPSGAHDFVALRIEGGPDRLCLARIKLVNDEYEGNVAPVKGLDGCGL